MNILKITQDEMRKIVIEWIHENERIVEIGCNDGNFAELLNKRDKFNYLGIDIQEDKILKAKKILPNFTFKCCNILENFNYLKRADTIVSFQCLEHIEEDIEILKEIPKGVQVIISVPNSNYRGHVRWFELDGWKERFETYIDFIDIITIQNPKKKKKRSFLFRGIRNGN